LKEFDTPADLAAWLAGKRIDTSRWEKEGAKRVTDLWAELAQGDSTLRERSPYRQVGVVQLIITRGDLVLVEAEQEFGDGQRRSRDRPPSEKLKTKEGYAEGARRCLREELGLKEPDLSILYQTHKLTKETADSTSYPGLMTEYAFHTVWVKVSGLPESDFWADNGSYHPAGDPVRRHRWAWRPLRWLPAGFQEQGSSH